MKLEIYLNEELKRYYMTDFTQNVVNCANEAWRLDPEMKERMSRINAGSDIQTLYSKNSRQTTRDSYIVFCYTSKIENRIFRELIPRLMVVMNEAQEESPYQLHKLTYVYNYPKGNSNYREREVPFGLNCLDDPEYFRVNHIRLWLEGGSDAAHLQFWNYVTDALCKLSKD